MTYNGLSTSVRINIDRHVKDESPQLSNGWIAFMSKDENYQTNIVHQVVVVLNQLIN